MKNSYCYLAKYFLILFFISNTYYSQGQKPHQPSSSEIQQKIKKLNVLGNVLYFAAHPDDENTRLIAYMANHKLVNTAYMSMTRGDGGQNLVGPEIREQLGIIRTQELLKARSVDGGNQFFSRANDFGFSKSYQETLKVWGKDDVLSDAVWVIRNFRPDVIITRFPPDERAGHGHHTTSAMLAIEAFDLAGNPEIYPEQLEFVEPWQPKNLYINTGRWWRNEISEDMDSVYAIDVGGYDPLLGTSYSEIAALSRSMHKSQGFGSTGTRGESKEYLELVKGGLPGSDIFEDIDLSWARVSKGSKFEAQVNAILKDFKPGDPSHSVPALLKLYDDLLLLPDLYWQEIKRNEVKQLIKDCLGLYIEVKSDRFYATPGEKTKMEMELINRSDLPVKFVNFEMENTDVIFLINKNLEPNARLEQEFDVTIPENLPISNPYWLAREGSYGLFNVTDQLTIGQPENRPTLQYKVRIMVNQESLEYDLPVIYKYNDRVKGEVYRPFVVLPPLTVSTNEDVIIFSDEKPGKIHYTIKSFTDSVINSELQIEVPEGWKVEPESVIIERMDKGEEKVFEFELTPPDKEGVGEVKPLLKTALGNYTRGYVEIAYDHIPTQVLMPETSTRLVKLNIAKNGQLIGYLPGAGDEIPANLERIGYDVDILENEDINERNLSQYDAIVLGIRALNTVPRMKYYKETLFSYVENGGTLIVQYNTSGGLDMTNFSPYDLKISRGRVTEEDAEVKFLDRDHPILNQPNKITKADFDGWVQERGLYFPESWGKEFVPILSWKDSDEENDLEGSLLVAEYGKGYYVYTGISFFRQLPAGVPGAYRLFANIVGLGGQSEKIKQ